MNKSYDLIVIGAGSVGVPVAMEFSKKRQSVLVVDSLSSPGQGEDKKAIGVLSIRDVLRVFARDLLGNDSATNSGLSQELVQALAA